MGGKQIMETFWLLATFMNHDGAWIKGREDTQITTSCSGRTLLSREKRHDYFKHSLPSGLWERKETLSSSWMSLKCSSPRQIFKTHKIIPVDSLRVFTSESCQCLRCRFPFPLDHDPGDPGISWVPWPPVPPPAAPHSNEIITMFVQCRPDQ